MHRLLQSLFVVATIGAAGRPILAGESQTGTIGSPPAERPAAIPEGAAGMKVYIDPQTGTIRRDPAPGTLPLQLTPQEQNALSTSHQGLVETPSPVPGGGVKLDLQGRFQSPLIGTIDANGKVQMRHLGEMPTNSVDKK
jgi:hypothetical protein